MPDTLRNIDIPKAWPFEEAAKVAARLAASGKTEALFETGYGPSGLPHIGTFGEVARTTWVRNAFTTLTGLPSRLLAFSDDMDGLRKVPDNVPNREMLTAYIGQPLTRVPDPFGTHDSFRSTQQRPPSRLSRWLRLRLRIRLQHRLLRHWPLRLRSAHRRCPP